MLAVAVLTSSSDNRITAIDLYPELMATSRRRLWERIGNEVVRAYAI